MFVYVYLSEIDQVGNLKHMSSLSKFKLPPDCLQGTLGTVSTLSPTSAAHITTRALAQSRFLYIHFAVKVLATAL